MTQWRCSCGRLCSYSGTVALFMWPADCRLCLLNSAVLLSTYKTPGHCQLYGLHFTASFICTVHNDCYCTRLYTSSDWQWIMNWKGSVRSCVTCVGCCAGIVWGWGRQDSQYQTGCHPAPPKHNHQAASCHRRLFHVCSRQLNARSRTEKEIINFALLECDAV